MAPYALLFPGQGSQSVGMGKDLYDQFTAAKLIFDEADAILNLALSQICFEGPAESLNETANTQPAVFVTSYVLLKVLEEEYGQALQPAAAAGHSLGEYTALAAAGAITFEDGLKLVQKRASLMQSAGENSAGGMAAVIGADLSALNSLVDEITSVTGRVLKIANDNCPGQLVVSGSPDALFEFESRHKECGARFVKRLPVSVACHTELMSSAQKEFNTILLQTEINPSDVDVIANTTAKLIRTAPEIKEELTNQLCGQVLWTQTTLLLEQIGCAHFLEIGPGKVLCGLTKRTLPQSNCVNFSGSTQLESTLQFLRGLER